MDGDTFTLVWDPDLLIAKNEAPSDYSAPTKPQVVDRVQLSHIKEWFINYFRARPALAAPTSRQLLACALTVRCPSRLHAQNDVLGHISNAHMTIADQFGPRCDACIKLCVHPLSARARRWPAADPSFRPAQRAPGFRRRRLSEDGHPGHDAARAPMDGAAAARVHGRRLATRGRPSAMPLAMQLPERCRR